MHVLHKDQQIKPWVPKSLHKAGSCSLALFQADGVSFNAVVCKLALLGSQPSCGERGVGKDEDTDYGDTNSDNTLYKVSLA